MDRTTPGKVLGEDGDSPPEPVRKTESKDEVTLPTTDVTTPPKSSSPKRARCISHFRPGQGFSPIQAMLDPGSPANWVSRHLVQEFPRDRFKSTPAGSRNLRYRYAEGCHLQGEGSITITWRCSSGKTFESEFLIFHMRGGAVVPNFIFGHKTLGEYEDELRFCTSDSSFSAAGGRARAWSRIGNPVGEIGSRSVVPRSSTPVQIPRHHRVSKSGPSQRREMEVRPRRLASWSR